MTTKGIISGEIAFPQDRKFGRARDKIAPLNSLQLVGVILVLMVGVFLMACGAALATVFALPLDA